VSDAEHAEAVSDQRLLAARRRLARRIAAAVVTAMAETDTSFEEMAQRLGMRTDIPLRNGLATLVDGGTRIPFDHISDLMTGCGYELTFGLRASHPIQGEEATADEVSHPDQRQPDTYNSPVQKDKEPQP